MSFSDRVPDFLLGKSQLVATVTFTALFSFVFLMLSIPFSNNAWFKIGADKSFGFTLAFFLLALSLVITSKNLMFKMRHSIDFTYRDYILWNLAEILAICLLYTFFTIEGDEYGIINIENKDFSQLFGSAFVYTLTSLGVPYVLAGQYFTINDKNNTIRLMNMSSVVGDLPDSRQEDKRITLFDNNGVMKFSILQENLYYIESDDNYIQVWYMDRTGGMKQYMVRCRLKTIEDSFAGSDLVRCHRKYIVNMTKVKVLRAEKDAYYIDLDIDSLEPIPVSKTYEEVVLSRFNSR